MAKKLLNFAARAKSARESDRFVEEARKIHAIVLFSCGLGVSKA